MKRRKLDLASSEPCSITCHHVQRSPRPLSSKHASIIHKYAKIFGPDPCFIYQLLKYLQIPLTCSQIASIIPKNIGHNVVYKAKPTNYNRRIFDNHAFKPCSHTGPCLNNKDCICYTSKTYCEISCQCQSCNLSTSCSCKTCDHSCPCTLKSRECSCHIQHCTNKAILSRSQCKTYISTSSTSGFGLFAGEPIKACSFVIEYIGEIISLLESERRGIFYDQKMISYLFGLRTENESVDTIDATRMGNSARFINHSMKSNLLAKQVMANGMVRIAFYAKNDIKMHEELFFDYKYDEQKKELYHIVD